MQSFGVSTELCHLHPWRVRSPRAPLGAVQAVALLTPSHPQGETGWHHAAVPVPHGSGCW